VVVIGVGSAAFQTSATRETFVILFVLIGRCSGVTRLLRWIEGVKISGLSHLTRVLFPAGITLFLAANRQTLQAWFIYSLEEKLELEKVRR